FPLQFQGTSQHSGDKLRMGTPGLTVAVTRGKVAETGLNELSVNKLKQYKLAAGSPDVVRTAPLRKVAKHVQGSHIAGQKIKAKTGDRTVAEDPEPEGSLFPRPSVDKVHQLM